LVFVGIRSVEINVGISYIATTIAGKDCDRYYQSISPWTEPVVPLAESERAHTTQMSLLL